VHHSVAEISFVPEVLLILSIKFPVTPYNNIYNKSMFSGLPECQKKGEPAKICIEPSILKIEFLMSQKSTGIFSQNVLFNSFLGRSLFLLHEMIFRFNEPTGKSI
jgi:hypothetical protein